MLSVKGVSLSQEVDEITSGLDEYARMKFNTVLTDELTTGKFDNLSPFIFKHN